MVPPDALRNKFTQLVVIIWSAEIGLRLWKVFHIVLQLILGPSYQLVWLADLSFFKEFRQVLNVSDNGRYVLVPPHHFLMVRSALV
jgi:hypothetical protein